MPKTSWPVRTLGEICDFVGGGTPSKDRPEFYGGDIPWATVRDLNVEILRTTEHSITREAIKSSSSNIVPAGSVVIATRVGLGKAVIIAQDTAINQDLRGLVVKNPHEVLADYLFWWYLSAVHLVVAAGTGATVQGVKLPFIRGLTIPVPPLEEQKRIVALLDAATARVTELTACYEQARTHAKLLSGSLLVELLTGVVGSEPMRLGDIAELKGRIGWRGLTAKEYTKEGPLFVSVHSLNYGHFVDLKDAFHISQERYDESPEIMLKNHDILICKDGAGIGKLGMVGELPGLATINSSLLLIRASSKVRSEFLYFYLLSPIFQNLVQERLSGSTTPHLYQRDIAELVIELPSLETQDHLIKQMWSALGRQGDLVECFNEQIDAMMRMRQSILESAFAGAL